MLGMILVTSSMSRTETVTRVAVSKLRKSLVFLFLMTMTRKRRLRRMAAKAMTDQLIHHQVGLGIREICRNVEIKQEH